MVNFTEWSIQKENTWITLEGGRWHGGHLVSFPDDDGSYRSREESNSPLYVSTQKKDQHLQCSER